MAILSRPQCVKIAALSWAHLVLFRVLLNPLLIAQSSNMHLKYHGGGYQRFMVRSYHLLCGTELQCINFMSITWIHCGIMMPYGHIDLGQLWLIMACCWKTPNHYLSLLSKGFWGTHLRPISQKVLRISILDMSLKNTKKKKNLKYKVHLCRQ